MTQPVAVIAEFVTALKFLVAPQPSTTGELMVGGPAQFFGLTVTHMTVSAVAVIVAAAIAVPIGLYLGHIGKGGFLAIGASNVGRAIPTLTLIGVFIAFIGIGFWNIATVLTLLAIPPMLTNSYVGVRQVDGDTVDAARGMGMTELEIIRKVELPLALPLIFGGLRLAAVAVVATAIIGPLSNTDTLGVPIINVNIWTDGGQLAAAILVTLITLATDVALGALQRAVTPKGLKLSAQTRQRGSFLSSLRRREQPT